MKWFEDLCSENVELVLTKNKNVKSVILTRKKEASWRDAGLLCFPSLFLMKKEFKMSGSGSPILYILCSDGLNLQLSSLNLKFG